MSNKKRRISMIIDVVEWMDLVLSSSDEESQSIVISKVVLKSAKGNLMEALKTDGITGIRGDVKVNSHE